MDCKSCIANNICEHLNGSYQCHEFVKLVEEKFTSRRNNIPKMTVEQFKDKVDGLLNDLHDMFIDDTEFRTGILELLLEVTEPFLAKEVEKGGREC